MSEVEVIETKSSDLFSKVQSYLTSKKGLYLVLALLIMGAIFYYKVCMKKEKKETEKPVEQGIENNNMIPLPQQNYQPPPGYVTVPVEMLQGLQNEQMYSEVPQDDGEQPNIGAVYDNTPQLRHNNAQKLDDDSEDDEIKNQDLTKNDMESIQAQLNSMQQTRSSL